MTLHHGDCIEVMAGMDPESVDAIVTDPPYGLEFMGKEWDRLWDKRPNAGGRKDHVGNDGVRRVNSMGRPGPTYVGGSQAQQFHARWAEAAYRVAKPSAYLLAFGGTRTVHRMTVALEDAGWIIRDMLVWAYASGFPKSKASLKPAWEPIVMARKPGPLRMLAIDECRIGVGDEVPGGGGWAGGADGRVSMRRESHRDDRPTEPHTLGRWPANVILTDPIFDGGVESVVGGGEASYNPPGVFGQQRDDQPGDTAAPFAVRKAGDGIFGYGDSGTYSRFFLIPKADRSDREPVLGGLVRDVDARLGLTHGGPGEPGKGTKAGYEYHPKARANVHPTVKPTELMRHLVRLVTPTGGTVLDPFLGSGTTGLAAEMEGFQWVGIEREAEYVAIAEARLNGVQRGLGLESA